MKEIDVKREIFFLCLVIILYSFAFTTSIPASAFLANKRLERSDNKVLLYTIFSSC